MAQLIGCIVSLALSILTGWFFLMPARLFLFSLIPATAEYAWIGKLIIIIMIGWLGGIAIPLTILIAGVCISLQLR